MGSMGPVTPPTVREDAFEVRQPLQERCIDDILSRVDTMTIQASRQAMDGDPSASILAAPRQRDYIDLSRPIRIDQGLTEAHLAAMTQRIDPRDVVPIPSNEVGSVDEAAAREAGCFVGIARTLDPVPAQGRDLGRRAAGAHSRPAEKLLPRHDIWGNAVEGEGEIGPDFLSPMAASTALHDPVNKALLQTDYAPGYPSKKVGGRELNSEDFDCYAERTGKASHAALAGLVASPRWKAGDETKAEAAQKLVTRIRGEVRGELFGGGACKAASAAPANEWSGIESVEGRTVRLHPMIARLLAAPRCYARTRSGKSCCSQPLPGGPGAGSTVASVRARHGVRPKVSKGMVDERERRWR